MTAKPCGKPYFLFPSCIAFAFPIRVLACWGSYILIPKPFPSYIDLFSNMSRQFCYSFKLFFEKFTWGLCSIPVWMACPVSLLPSCCPGISLHIIPGIPSTSLLRWILDSWIHVWFFSASISLFWQSTQIASWEKLMGHFFFFEALYKYLFFWLPTWLGHKVAKQTCCICTNTYRHL